MRRGTAIIRALAPMRTATGSQRIPRLSAPRSEAPHPSWAILLGPHFVERFRRGRVSRRAAGRKDFERPSITRHEGCLRPKPCLTMAAARSPIPPGERHPKAAVAITAAFALSAYASCIVRASTSPALISKSAMAAPMAGGRLNPDLTRNAEPQRPRMLSSDRARTSAAKQRRIHPRFGSGCLQYARGQIVIRVLVCAGRGDQRHQLRTGVVVLESFPAHRSKVQTGAIEQIELPFDRACAVEQQAQRARRAHPPMRRPKLHRARQPSKNRSRLGRSYSRRFPSPRYR